MSLKKERTMFVFQTPNSQFSIRGTAVKRTADEEARLKYPASVTLTSQRNSRALLAKCMGK